MRSTTAQRFNSYRASACIEIDEAAAIDAWRKDIEEGLAQAIAGWPGGKPAGRDQPPRTVCAGNDPHRV
jgi:hypothetical protein